jgi:predicted RNase H-like HicB family nuclease
MESKCLIDRYTYRAEWSEDDSVHVTRCLEFPSIAAHGSTEGIALTEIKKAITASIKWMEEENEPIPEPLNELESD